MILYIYSLFDLHDTMTIAAKPPNVLVHVLDALSIVRPDIVLAARPR